MSGSRHSDLILYRRLIQQVQPYGLHLLAILLLSLLSIPLALLTPLPLKIVVDNILGSQPLQVPFDSLWLQAGLKAISESSTVLLMCTIGLMILVGLLAHVQSLLTWLMQTYTGERLVLNFRITLFRHVQRISLLYHDAKGTTDSIYRIQYDAPAIQWIATQGVIPLITAAVSLASMIAVTAVLDWQLASIAMAVMPALFLLIHSSQHRLRSRWTQLKEMESSAMSVVQEVLTAVRVVKAFGQEKHEEERFVHHSNRSLRGQIGVALLESSFDLFVGMAIVAGTAAVLFIGVRHVQSGLLSLGNLLMIMTYLSQLYAPLQTITKQVAQLQGSLASAERAFALLDETPEVIERPHARRLVTAKGAVAFQNVCFRYTDQQRGLQDISFHVEAGTRIGVAGTTGAGKTTLVSLLPRFYDPEAGQILLDGIDLREYQLADLRRQFSIVLQEPVLFASSIGENIAYARPESSQAEIIAAAKAAHAHEFISGMPDCYGTQVGERGIRLSGGERQRISIARAFLRDAPILILDEPTSSVDLATEAFIMEAMDRLMKGRTTFIIAHRLSTLEKCDVVLTIKDGRLATMTKPPYAKYEANAYASKPARTVHISSSES